MNLKSILCMVFLRAAGLWYFQNVLDVVETVNRRTILPLYSGEPCKLYMKTELTIVFEETSFFSSYQKAVLSYYSLASA